MPQMQDPRFAHSVVFLCTHSADGAMGLVVNRQFVGLSFGELLEQLEIFPGDDAPVLSVQAGGPVEPGRGFVLHSLDYRQEATLAISETIGLTATVDILRAIAEGHGPRQVLLALGYCGWGPGQLDAEIRENAWLNVPSDLDLVFSEELDSKWKQAIARLGISLAMLSSDAGHA